MSNNLVAMNNQITSIMLNESNMDQMYRVAQMMADGFATTPKHLRGNVADCFAVTLQAHTWGMLPSSVAQKTHLVSGTLGYEGQLVNSVITSSNAIEGRFHYKTIGDWSQWKLGDKRTEEGLGIQVGAMIAGETEIQWDDILYIAPITARNSPLWATRPLQQLKYLGVKYWARIYTPAVIMGVYTPDELKNPEQEERDITGAVDDLNDALSTQASKIVVDGEVITPEQEIKPDPVKAKPAARVKPRTRTTAQASSDISKVEGKPDANEKIIVDLKGKEVTHVPVDNDASAYNELIVKAQNVENAAQWNEIKAANSSAYKAGLITGAEANSIQNALKASKAALMAKK